MDAEGQLVENWGSGLLCEMFGVPPSGGRVNAELRTEMPHYQNRRRWRGLRGFLDTDCTDFHGMNHFVARRARSTRRRNFPLNIHRNPRGLCATQAFKYHQTIPLYLRVFASLGLIDVKDFPDRINRMDRGRKTEARGQISDFGYLSSVFRLPSSGFQAGDQLFCVTIIFREFAVG